MSSAELRAYSVERYSSEAVLALKGALCMDPDLPRWLSADGGYMYLANPVEEVPPEALPYMPAWQFTQCMNAWQLGPVPSHPEEGVFHTDLYTIIAGITVIATRHELSLEMLTEGKEEETALSMYESVRLQCQLGWQHPESIDYANIDNALHDLKNEIELYKMANSH